MEAKFKIKQDSRLQEIFAQEIRNQHKIYFTIEELENLITPEMKEGILCITNPEITVPTERISELFGVEAVYKGGIKPLLMEHLTQITGKRNSLNYTVAAPNLPLQRYDDYVLRTGRFKPNWRLMEVLNLPQILDGEETSYTFNELTNLLNNFISNNQYLLDKKSGVVLLWKAESVRLKNKLRLLFRTTHFHLLQMSRFLQECCELVDESKKHCPICMDKKEECKLNHRKQNRDSNHCEENEICISCAKQILRKPRSRTCPFCRQPISHATTYNGAIVQPYGDIMIERKYTRFSLEGARHQIRSLQRVFEGVETVARWHRLT